MSVYLICFLIHSFTADEIVITCQVFQTSANKFNLHSLPLTNGMKAQEDNSVHFEYNKIIFKFCGQQITQVQVSLTVTRFLEVL
jgi:hypothetical protein